ncbi:hypothetical protein Goklo_021695, partial [Gossypium klotzschianum]|nr:hypothetical protein [Gossypium klotzschianum]
AAYVEVRLLGLCWKLLDFRVSVNWVFGLVGFGFGFVQIIKKDVESSIIRSSIDYKIDAKLQELTSQATTKPMEIWKE